MAATTDAGASAHLYVKREAQWRPIEFVFWAATLLPFLLFPNYLSLASQIAITALFALSLDLILGYAGIVSLGHAAFFGLGAYTAGILSVHGWGDPLIGLAGAAVAAGILGYATSFIIAHFRHLALIMITLGLGLLLHELANTASWLTGGSDGLQGVNIKPLLGRFSFDLYGYTAYAYSLVVLFVVFLAVRRLVNSPFGLALRGIRENAVRMPAIGAPSAAHIRKVYTISAIIAGIAGALLTQTTSTVSLSVLDFQRSADVVVILILGGAGRLYGGLDRRHHLHGGARPVLRHQSAAVVLLDRPAARRRGDVPAQRRARRLVAAGRDVSGQAVVSTPPDQRVGIVHAGPRQALRLAGRRQRHHHQPAARRALCADRAQRRRQDHAHQSDHRHAAARHTAASTWARRTSPRSSRTSASSAGWCAPSRSTRCSRISTRWRR